MFERLKERYKEHKEWLKKDKERRYWNQFAHIKKGTVSVPKPDYDPLKVEKPSKDLNTCDEYPLYDEYREAYMKNWDTMIFTQKVEDLIRSMQKDVYKLREEDLIGKYCLVCKVMFPKDTEVCPDCSVALRPVYKGRSG